MGDIDIIGKLVPNPLSMVVQLCSTLVLFLLVKKFLWKSVQNFFNARTEKMQSDLTAGEQAKNEAIADRDKAHEQIEAERNAMYDSVKEEMVNVAMDAAGKLIGEKNGDDLDRKAIAEFVKEASAHDE